MKIRATKYDTVTIDPSDVFEDFFRSACDHGEAVFKKDGKYFKRVDISIGNHSRSEDKKITKKYYDYVSSLETVIDSLEKRGVKSMEITAQIFPSIDVDPIKVIRKLLKCENFKFAKTEHHDNKYMLSLYNNDVAPAFTNSISKEEYEYYSALITVLNYLESEA